MDKLRLNPRARIYTKVCVCCGFAYSSPRGQRIYCSVRCRNQFRNDQYKIRCSSRFINQVTSSAGHEKSWASSQLRDENESVISGGI